MRSSPFCASLSLVALASVAFTLSSCGGFQSSPVVDGGSSFRFSLLAGSVAYQKAGPPLSLTASDGTGLELVQLSGRAVVEEPLAFTELHLVFQNPEARTIEGNFSITLPTGATVSRFAMKLDDRWQEGEVVEKKKAREAYEDFLHRRQDPALLEQAAGNEFSARVFPIPARGQKELILSYSQELPAEASYVLPLRGLPEVQRIDLAVSLAGERAPAAELQKENYAPLTDFVLDRKARKGGAGLRNGNLVLARVHPIADSHPDPIESAIVLVDTSASRALGFNEEVRLLAQLVAAIQARAGGRVPLIIGAYDQTTEPIFDGEAGAFGEREITRMRERQAFGASNLSQALSWAEGQAKTRGARRVILITDGVSTAGETEADQLRAVSARLKSVGVERIDAIAVGGIRDEALLRQVVTAGLPRDGVVADGAGDINVVHRRLTEATRSGIPVKIEGASFITPDTIDGAQAGDEVLVYADVPPEQTVRISVGGGASVVPDLVKAERPLLERAFAQAKIANLVGMQARKGQDAEMQREIIALSVAHRVVSPYTALLVLETERDYDRFKIDRKALADILAVEGSRVAVLKRSWNPIKSDDVSMPMPAPDPMVSLRSTNNPRPSGPPPAEAAPPPAARAAAPSASASPLGSDPLSARGNMWGSDISDSFGAGGLGLSGIGEGGGGRSEGIGLGSIGTMGHGASPGTGQGFGSGHGRVAGASKAATPPQVRMGATQVSGRLPPEVIQRIVRQNFGRFRGCYENGLRNNPSLQGRVSVKFVIDRTGAVTGAVNGGSDLPDPTVVACVVRSFTSLSFPQPEGGTVTVVYPIVFGNDSGSGGGAAPASLPASTPVAPPPPPSPPPPQPEAAQPYTGRFKTVMDALTAGSVREAIRDAFEWHKESPGDVMALVALGEAFESAGETRAAARAYGSIIDLFSSRADMRRFAGERLEHLSGGVGLDLALDSFQKAEEQRPDHPASHRLLAFARLRHGEYERAFLAMAAGVKQRYPTGRFSGVERILREDLGLIAAAWIKAEPTKKDEILSRLNAAGGYIEDAPSLRFVLNWETDANDVDFHIYDDLGGHAYYKDKTLPSGGDLYADVTTGYGPECFTIRGPKESRAKHYTLKAHYYARGPMGYGMGKLEIIDHDGKGGLVFEERTFVAMVDHAFVDLGAVRR